MYTAAGGVNFDAGVYCGRACGLAADDAAALFAGTTRAADSADMRITGDTISLGCLANEDVVNFDSGRGGVRAVGPSSASL